MANFGFVLHRAFCVQGATMHIMLENFPLKDSISNKPKCCLPSVRCAVYVLVVTLHEKVAINCESRNLAQVQLRILFYFYQVLCNGTDLDSPCMLRFGAF